MIAKNKERIYIVLLILLSLLILFCSPLHPFSRRFPDTDSSAFLLIGQSMWRGIFPYTDIFDHKGPLLYVINWLGMSMGFTGVWIIELVFMLVSTWLCYRCARRFFSEAASFWGTFAVFLASVSWYQGGNLTGVWSLPFFFGALYCLTGYFDNNFELSRVQILISGICLGGVLMIRPNMIGIWFGMCTMIFFHTILIRKFQTCLRCTIFFILGIVISVAPFLIWLGMKGALVDFYFCYIKANFLYIDNNALSDRIFAIAHQLKFPIVMLVAIILLILLFRQKWELKNPWCILVIALSISFGVSVIMAALSGYIFGHYYMALVPCLILPISWIIEKGIINLKLKQFLIFIIIIYVLNSPLRVGIDTIRATMFENTQLNTLAQIVVDNNPQGEPILSVGNSQIYLKTGFAPASYYPYFVRGTSHPTIVEDYISEIARNKPLLIIQTYFDLPIELRNYLNENYLVICQYEDAFVYRLI